MACEWWRWEGYHSCHPGPPLGPVFIQDNKVIHHSTLDDLSGTTRGKALSKVIRRAGTTARLRPLSQCRPLTQSPIHATSSPHGPGSAPELHSLPTPSSTDSSLKFCSGLECLPAGECRLRSQKDPGSNPVPFDSRTLDKSINLSEPADVASAK